MAQKKAKKKSVVQKKATAKKPVAKKKVAKKKSTKKLRATAIPQACCMAGGGINLIR